MFSSGCGLVEVVAGTVRKDGGEKFVAWRAGRAPHRPGKRAE